MKKLSKLVLMFCFILSGAFSYAYGAARTGNEKGIGDVVFSLILRNPFEKNE